MVHPGEWDLLPEYYGESFTTDEQHYFYGLAATVRLGGPEATRDLAVTSLLHVAWHFWRATGLAVGSSLTIFPIDQESEMVVARRGGAILLSGENAKGDWSLSLPEASFVASVSDLVAALSHLVSMRVPTVLANPTLTWLRPRKNVT